LIGKINLLSLHHNKKTMYKWSVSYTTPLSKGMWLKETVEGRDWFEAKMKLTSKTPGIVIKSYTPIK